MPSDKAETLADFLVSLFGFGLFLLVFPFWLVGGACYRILRCRIGLHDLWDTEYEHIELSPVIRRWGRTRPSCHYCRRKGKWRESGEKDDGTPGD